MKFMAQCKRSSGYVASKTNLNDLYIPASSMALIKVLYATVSSFELPSRLSWIIFSASRCLPADGLLLSLTETATRINAKETKHWMPHSILPNCLWSLYVF